MSEKRKILAELPVTGMVVYEITKKREIIL